MLHIAFAPIYRYELPEGHRFPMVKYELIAEQLLYEGIVQERQFFHPQILDEAIALQTHTKSYWDKLTNLTLSKSEERAIGFPINQHFIERGRYISGGTIQCVSYALQHGVAMNVAGGTHHAQHTPSSDPTQVRCPSRAALDAKRAARHPARPAGLERSDRQHAGPDVDGFSH